MLYNDYIKSAWENAKNAYQHKIHHQIYILESNQRNYEKKSRITDIKSNNENKLFLIKDKSMK